MEEKSPGAGIKSSFNASEYFVNFLCPREYRKNPLVDVKWMSSKSGLRRSRKCDEKERVGNKFGLYLQR